MGDGGKEGAFDIIGNGTDQTLTYNINTPEKHFEGGVTKSTREHILNQTHLVHFRRKKGDQAVL